MEAWVADLDSWDVCDGVCGNLFDRTPLRPGQGRRVERPGAGFQKRAAFALMASAVHRKDLPDRGVPSSCL